MLQAHHKLIPFLFQPLLITILPVFQIIGAVHSLVIIGDNPMLALHQVPHPAHVLLPPLRRHQNLAPFIVVQFVFQWANLVEAPLLSLEGVFGQHYTPLAAKGVEDVQQRG